MTMTDKRKLLVIAFLTGVVAIGGGFYLAGNVRSSLAASQNEHTNVVKTIRSVIAGDEKTIITKTVETLVHSHDGLPMHKHVVTVEVAVTETTPHNTFHDFPATQTDAPVAVANATGNTTGHDGHDGATPSPVGGSPQEPRITIMGREFMGGTLTVPAGTKVTWVNQESEPHTVTSDTGLFNGTLNLNDSFSFTFNEAGTYKYHCENRPEMTGTITVK